MTPFAASIPFPVSLALPGHASLSVLVADSLNHQGYLAFAARVLGNALKIEDVNERKQEAVGRAERETTQPPIMTGEQLVIEVLALLDMWEGVRAEEWRIADRMGLPWIEQEGKPVIIWRHLAERLGISPPASRDGLNVLIALAGLGMAGRVDRKGELRNTERDGMVLTLNEVLAILPHTRGAGGRALRRAVMPMPAKLVAQGHRHRK